MRIADDRFLRGKVPMTKEEVRTLALSKLDLTKGDVLWDVGAGSGSVGIQAALCTPVEAVCAFERNPAALELIEKNRKHLRVGKLSVFAGQAPACFDRGIIRPTKAFIGGSGGRLEEVLSSLLAMASVQIIVLSAVTLDTLERARVVFGGREDLAVSISQVQITRYDRLGHRAMAEAENPVFLLRAERSVTKDGV